MRIHTPTVLIPFTQCPCLCAAQGLISTAEGRREPAGAFDTQNKTHPNNNKQCARLTTRISIDHAADSRADVRGGGSCDRYGVLCPWTDIHHISL